MKKCLPAIILILLASILFFSACTNEIGFSFGGEKNLSEENDDEEDEDEDKEDEDEDEEEASDTPDPESPDPKESKDNKTEEPTPTPEIASNDSGIRPISMSEAGMEPIQHTDFNGAEVNPRIIELVKEPWNWDSDDFALGIDEYNYIFVIRPRFQENIVGSINMGSSLSDVTSELGTPGYTQEDLAVYKTDDYYLTFFGKEAIDLVSFMAVPEKDYDDDFLYDLIAELNSDSFTSLEASIEKLDPDMDFFNEKGSNDGTTYYAHSMYGINVSDETEPIIDIMNNYEGNLYIQDSGNIRFSQAFNNLDSNVLLQRDTLYRFNDIDRALDQEGVESPDGLLKAIYYENENCFIVRTLDSSIEDRFMYEFTNGEFFWLGSRYLLFISDFGDRPEFLDVDDSMAWGESLLEQVGLDETGTFKILKVEDQVITLENTDAGETVEIAYEFNDNGEIAFSVN